MAQLAKNPPAMWETWVQSLDWEDPLAKEKATYSSILAWRIPWTIVYGVAKSQTQLNDFHFHFSLSYIGEGNGNPLQCSGLENSMDCTVHRVTKSQTRLSDFD